MKVLIIGGTGTLGKALIAHYSSVNNNEVLCYSRDELKQQELKKEFPNLKCFLGDIREPIACHLPFENVDILYHVAALKHIDVLEDNILEALKTNVSGTVNVAHFAIAAKIPIVAFSSTDK